MTIAAPTVFTGLYSGGPSDPGVPNVTTNASGQPTDFGYFGKPGAQTPGDAQSGPGWLVGNFTNGTFVSGGNTIVIGPNERLMYVVQSPLTNLPTSGTATYSVTYAQEPSVPGGARSFDNSTTALTLGVAFGSSPKFGFDGKISGSINNASPAQFSFTTPGGSAAPSLTSVANSPGNLSLFAVVPVTGSTTNLCASDAACKFSANFIAGGYAASTFGVGYGLIDVASNKSILDGTAILTKNGATSSTNAPSPTPTPTPTPTPIASGPPTGSGLNFASYGVSAAVRESASVAVSKFQPSPGIDDYKLDSVTIDATTTGRGSAIDQEHGSVDGMVGWTRWAGGTTTTGTVIAANNGGSMIWGTHATAVPTSGRATYTMAGYTQPVANDGSLTPGTVNSSSLAVDFATAKVGWESNISINSATYAIQSPGGIATPAWALSSTGTFTSGGIATEVTGNGCTGTTCSGRVSGFLSGSGAAAAGLAYTFSAKPGGATAVNGVIGFRKN